MSASPYVYEGHELEVFQHAVRWKAYLRAQMAPFLRGHVAEVGAGLGATTQHLLQGTAVGAQLGNVRPASWLCLEPDAGLARELAARLALHPIATPIDTLVGTLRDVTPGRTFDAILYVDVLEHIADDAAELREAAARLAPGGAIVVLAPAHRWLYSPFDRAIGHHRRYGTASLEAIAPPGLTWRRLRYLDAAGLLASGANRLWLAQAMPTSRQVQIWDRMLVPISRVFDPLFAYRLGKSVLAVWAKS